MNITTRYAGVSAKQLQQYHKRLRPEVRRMQRAAANAYRDDRASINLPFDTTHLQRAEALARKHKRAALVIVVGIGGSNLGTWAVQEAVLGKQHNLTSKKKIFYADTVDAENIMRLNTLLAGALRRKEHVVINGVSKSGGTAETIANLGVFVQTLRNYRRNPKNHVVITTNEGSNFWQYGKEHGYATLPIPQKVGGRYSVFSLVGLFPLAVIGVNIRKLLAGARAMRTACMQTRKNPAITRAALLHHAYSKGRNIADNFYFRVDLENIGKWYRQLMGESIGKEWNKTHRKQVWMGITPTVSVGSTDLHSMAQLYFGGPDDKFFSIVTCNSWTNVKVQPGYESLVPTIKGKSFKQIMNAIVGGVTAVLRKQGRPFCTIELTNTNEHAIGGLLQLHMMEMMYLAALLRVNPFDQPNVEAYKIETKRLLK
ncbi:MAG: hypothetical protein OXR66_09720 [Candidatus Woesearchaeota archaeon]|nr:hypothetical protein [Candidatus Woesearchaeota archaeon]